MSHQFVKVTKTKVDPRSNTEGPPISIGYYTTKEADERFPSEYFCDKSIEWRVNTEPVYPYASYSDIYLQLLPEGGFVIVAGDKHETFLKALLERLSPRLLALKNVCDKLLGLTGTCYESDVKKSLIAAVSSDLSPFEKAYLRHFLQIVVMQTWRLFGEKH